MNHTPDEDVQRVIADLESVAASLTDISMTLLTGAIEAGSTERPEMDKRVTQARRAVEKAIRVLGGGTPE